MNLTTLERESRSLNGSDANKNIERNRKTFPEIVTPPWGAGSSEPSPEDPEEEEE